METKSDICPECKGKLEVGSWPFCNGDPAKHARVDKWFHEGFEPYV